jgi:hypothetical protein
LLGYAHFDTLCKKVYQKRYPKKLSLIKLGGGGATGGKGKSYKYGTLSATHTGDFKIRGHNHPINKGTEK